MPRTAKLIDECVADSDRGRINNVPILHPTEGSRQINLLRLSIRQGALRQRCHTPFQGRVEPPIERRARDSWHLKLQVGPQDVGLIGAAQCPRRDDHRPDQHPEVQPLPLDDPTPLAQVVHLVLRQHWLKHDAHVVACHRLSPYLTSHGLPVGPSAGSRAVGNPEVKEGRLVATVAVGLS